MITNREYQSIEKKWSLSFEIWLHLLYSCNTTQRRYVTTKQTMKLYQYSNTWNQLREVVTRYVSWWWMDLLQGVYPENYWNNVPGKKIKMKLSKRSAICCRDIGEDTRETSSKKESHRHQGPISEMRVQKSHKTGKKTNKEHKQRIWKRISQICKGKSKGNMEIYELKIKNEGRNWNSTEGSIQ